MQARKPIDLGNGRLVASFARSRPALLSVLVYQPQHGVAELTAMPRFDEHRRGDPIYVREYRQLMADEQSACLELVTLDGKASLAESVELADPYRPAWRGRIGPVPFDAAASADGSALVIEWRFSAADASSKLQLRFRGRLDRPALAEITEVNPPPPTGAVTSLRVDGARLHVSSSLPAELTIDAEEGAWQVGGGGAWLDPAGRADPTIRVQITIGDGRLATRPRQATNREEPGVPGPAAGMVARALAYVRTCAALRTADDEAVLMADHRLLPLSWTRDAYWGALLLLATGDPADQQLAGDHLRWLWRRCERPDGRWLRSHHANGRPKDRAFQVDQQLYPMIELADFWRATGELPAGVDWPAQVSRAWAAAAAAIEQTAGLVATTENAADDPAPAPFIASSQILFWYAAMRLAEIAGGVELNADELRSTAATVRSEFNRHLIADGRWLYASDARRKQVAYHDANDLPVALAPLLGFCAGTDPAWRATLEFAFSEANPGYYPGERGGLGSRHTPAPWTLGDIQAWLWARVRGDVAAMAAAVDRLVNVAFEDGMLPEAYSADLAPDVRIRHWFAWPGAAAGALLLLDSRGELERLRPRR
jgi:hypothetical protein